MTKQEIIQAILQNMESVSRVMAAKRIAGASSLGATPAQIGIMMTVVHVGPQNIKDLAKSFGMTSSAVTQLVNGLVKEKLMLRVEDLKDRRKISLELTEKGKQILAVAKKKREEMMVEVFKPLSLEELTTLEKIQRKITQNLQIIWTKKQNN